MNSVKNFFKNYIGTIAVIALVYVWYNISTETGALDGYLFPKVGAIADSFREKGPEMLLNFRASFELLIPGVLAGVLIALVIGVILGLSKGLRKMCYPIIYAASMIPVVLLSPFAVHMAPSLRAASMFLVIWGTVWGVMFSAINGIMTIDKRYLDNAKTLELNKPTLLFRVILPAAMPSIAGGFITSLRGAFLSLVFAEMYGTKLGMGYFVKLNSDFSRFEHVWSGFLFLALVMVVLMQIIEKIKDHMLRWTID